MYVRCDNQYRTGADRGNILGQSIPLECMGICLLSTARECGMRGPLVYLLIVKYLSRRFGFKSAAVIYIGRPCVFWGVLFKLF